MVTPGYLFRIIIFPFSSFTNTGDPGLSPNMRLLLPHRLVSELMKDLLNLSISLGEPRASLMEMKLGYLEARFVDFLPASTPDF